MQSEKNAMYDLFQKNGAVFSIRDFYKVSADKGPAFLQYIKEVT